MYALESKYILTNAMLIKMAIWVVFNEIDKFSEQHFWVLGENFSKIHCFDD